jgi:hypothetical protein
VSENNSGGFPAGNYEGVFKEAENLPAKEPDLTTGEGGRQWAKVVFKWEITKGDHTGKTAIRETPQNTGMKSGFVQVCGWVMGKPLTPKDAITLRPFVGRKYLLTIGNKTDKNGMPTNWTHVSNAMPTPM